MARRTALIAIYTLTLGAVVALLIVLARDQRSRPLILTRASLSGWRVVAGDPADPWVVAARPPDAVINALRERVARASPRPVTALPRVVLPLILRQEFEDALQGIYGIDRLIRLAEDAAIPGAQFEPLCIAERVDPERGALVFLAVDAAAYWQYRGDVEPFQPEQGGSGVFDPGALTPLVPIAASRRDTVAWWPLKTDPLADCIAPVVVE